MKEVAVEQKCVVGLDIGSTHVSAIVISNEQILGATRVHNSGMRKGTMIDLEAVSDAVGEAVDEVERQSGVAVQEARVSVCGVNAKSENFTERVSVKNNEVRATDIDRLVSQAKSQKPPAQFEVIHDVLGYFILDGKAGIISPEGMWGAELAAVYHRIVYPQADLFNVLRACNNAGMKVQSFAFEALAAAQAVLDEDEKELGVVSINLGAELTHVSVFSSGVPLFCKDYPIGSHHITKDLAVGLRTTQTEAERIKRDAASACYFVSEAREQVGMQTMENTRRYVTKGEIAQIVEPRIREIFLTILADLERFKLAGLLAKGIVLSGGGSMLNGICIAAEDVFNLHSRIGLPLRLSGLTEGLRTPQSCVSVGLTNPMFASVQTGHSNFGSPTKIFGFARNLLSKVKDSLR